MRKAEVERAEEFSRTGAGGVDSPLESNITVRRSLTQLGGGDREAMEKELAVLRETVAGYSHAGFDSVNDIQRQIQVLETQRTELESQITEVCNLIAEGTGNNIAVTSIQDLESAIRQLLVSALGADPMSRNEDVPMHIRGEGRKSMLGQDGHVLSVSDKMEIYLKEHGLRTHARRDDDAQYFGGIAAIVEQVKSMESAGILQQSAPVFNTVVLTHAQMTAMKAALRTQLRTPKAILTEKEFYE